MIHRPLVYADTGTVLKATLHEPSGVMNLTGVTLVKVFLKKPSGVVVELTGSVFEDPAQGRIAVTLAAGILNELGWWGIQAFVQTGAGEWSSLPDHFLVVPKYGA